MLTNMHQTPVEQYFKDAYGKAIKPPLKWPTYKTFSVGNNITCSINCNYRVAAALYTPETWFVSDIHVNTQPKDDNK